MAAPGHPVLDQQRALAGGAVDMPMDADPDGFLDDLGDFVDDTPRFLAGLILGAVLTLLLLRVAGFRFSFGAQLGAGG